MASADEPPILKKASEAGTERRAPSARAVTADAEQKKRDLAQKAKTMKKPFDT